MRSALVLAASLVVTGGCAGKKRNFGESIAAAGAGSEAFDDGVTDDSATDDSNVVAEGGSGSIEASTSSEGEVTPSLDPPDDDAEVSSASQPAAADTCGDACSGECEPGEAQCTSPTERIECGIDALWGDPVACPSVCIDGSCTGECVPGSTECVTTTRFRECSELGAWSEVTDCEFACVGTACGGVCQPGETRCDSSTTVQVCNDQGQWGPTSACQNACVGDACTGECVPGVTRCSSETQLQTCNEQGQFRAGTACPFVCVDGACRDCTPGSRRCDPASGVPQVCTGAATWQSQEACARSCQNGACVAQLGLGLECNSARDCSSGFCVDGVCCESQCGGVCAQCEAGSGRCFTPATDPECDPVICASNECQISGGNLTTNLCRSRGQCKDQRDCNFSRFDRGAPCDTTTSDFRFCDGAGSCIDPTVTCNGIADRTVGEDAACCDVREGVRGSFVITESYGPVNSCAPRAFSSPGATRITCDENSDCRAGETCCVTAASGGSLVTCLPASMCDTTMPFVSYQSLCASPKGFTVPCPAGTSCLSLSGGMIPGWAYCR